MSTFLQLCQAVTRRSGTISGTLPAAVTNQTGRLQKIVEFTDLAWQGIQRSRNAWLWMRAECEVDTTADLATYTAVSFGLTDWAEWIVDRQASRPSDWSLYLTATGVSDEGPLYYMDWLAFRRIYQRGTQTANKPTHFTVNDANAIVLGPTPDAVYTVRGMYRRTVQVLSANGDIPQMPERFHDLIVWEALKMLAGHDEAPAAFASAHYESRKILQDLERDQLPLLRATSRAIA